MKQHIRTIIAALLSVAAILPLTGCATLAAPAPREASAAAGQPAGVMPNLAVVLCWSGEQVMLPPPIDANRLIFQSPQYRRWQFRGENSEYAWTNPGDGLHYTVKTVGKEELFSTVKTMQTGREDKKKKGRTPVVREEVIGGHSVRMIVSSYRPDGTLDTVTTFRGDSSIDGWVAYAPDGQRRLVKVQLRSGQYSPTGAPLIQYVNFYDSDRIRQFQVNQRNEAWQELVVTESGAIRQRLHEEPAKADVMLRLGVK